MNVLILGDKLSYDISCYLPLIAKSAKEDISFINISGYTNLEEMYRKGVSDAPLSYTVRYNGTTLPLSSLTLRRVLASREFSYAIIAQAPRSSCDAAAYDCLAGICALIRESQPSCTVVLSQGYAYEDGFPILHNTLGYKTRADMTARLIELTSELAGREDIHTVAPTALAQSHAEDAGYRMMSDKVTLTAEGMYLGSLMLYQCISRKSAVANKLVPDGIGDDKIAELKEIAQATAKEMGLR